MLRIGRPRFDNVHVLVQFAPRRNNFRIDFVGELFRVETGKNIWEIVPRELGNKGSAVAQEMAGLPGGTVPVYLGDDQADEAAFAALPHGITVRVGERGCSRAHYRLAGVPQVRAFLYKLKTEFV